MIDRFSSSALPSPDPPAAGSSSSVHALLSLAQQIAAPPPLWQLPLPPQRRLLPRSSAVAAQESKSDTDTANDDDDASAVASSTSRLHAATAAGDRASERAATALPAAAAASAPIALAKPKKVRKRTYYMRKEETQVLLAELQDLEARAAFFHKNKELAAQWKRIRLQQRNNRTLRSAIQSQRLVFAATRSMMAHFMQEHDAEAYESCIKLGMDAAQRRATLLALKPERLRDAVAFLRARGGHLDQTKPFVDAQRFENAQGDYCSVRFDVTPFEGLQSARQVFDAYMNFAFNMEINVSATLGDITIREDDDAFAASHDGVSHHRMVSTIANTVQLDLNSVVFSEFYPNGHHLSDKGPDTSWATRPTTTTTTSAPARELGVIVFDVVDDDARYPYRPNERVRQDVTCFAMVSSFRRKKFSSDPRRAATSFHNRVLLEEDEVVVVLQRWSLLRVRRSDFYVPEEIVARIKSSIEHVTDSILTTVRQAVYASPGA